MLRMDCLKIVSTCLALFLSTATTTKARDTTTAKEALAQYGMLGKWAPDCSKPPSANNVYALFVGKPNGEVKRTYLQGPDDIVNEYRIVRAKLRDDNTLWAEQFSLDTSVAKHVLLVFERKDNRYHVIWSKIVGGDALVDEGNYTQARAKLSKTPTEEGQQAPWSYKCE
jgi:hypothetical protein